ncbi:MAG: hypothetical protein HYR84_07165 [Planctomycetes bacterium]|nr:hypothetical protein [Planctomycetota bacterium]
MATTRNGINRRRGCSRALAIFAGLFFFVALLSLLVQLEMAGRFLFGMLLIGSISLFAAIGYLNPGSRWWSFPLVLGAIVGIIILVWLSQTLER